MNNEQVNLPMNVLTRIFLVLLRLAIGWHFLFEGLDKLDSYFRGPVDGKKVWSSEAYLRESTGPLAPFFRNQLGDPDEAALERLTLPPTRPGERPQLPSALAKDWKDAYDRFLAFYGIGNEKAFEPEVLRFLALNPSAGLPGAEPWAALGQFRDVDRSDNLQLVLARSAFQLAESEALFWLQYGKREVEVTFSKVTERVVRTTPQRIQAYRKKLQDLHDIEEHGLQAFGRDVWKKKLNVLKDEIVTMRTELLADLNLPMKHAMEATLKYRLSPPQRARGTLPEPETKTRLWWINQITMWGITAVGTCLIVGLFTRLACLGGAAFLLSVYLAMPALPWLPINPRAEGHYFFINKNIVELLALLVLATTQSGRWAGLDGLFYFFGPWRLRKSPPSVTNKEWGAPHGSVSTPADFGSASSSPPPIMREPSHGP